jgi:DNA mismatch repair protein MutS
MCGVPIHAADDYLQKLIALGHRVAVCEQVEDPAEARKRGSKSVVKRDVVRLVTPGTITEDKLLAPAESNYLMALGACAARRRMALGLAWIESRPAQFRVAETSAERLLSDISPHRAARADRRGAGPSGSGPASRSSLPRPHRQPQPAQPVRDATAAAAHRALLRRRHARTGFGGFARGELSAIAGIASPMSRRRRRASARRCRDRARGRRRDALHRRGDPRQPRTAAHPFRRARRLAVLGHRPHGHGRPARGCSPTG